MIFDKSQRLALTVIREKATLVELGTGQEANSESGCYHGIL